MEEVNLVLSRELEVPTVSVVETKTNLLHSFIKSHARSESQVFSLARRCLPHHLLPARLHFLPELPLTEHGKTDLRVLRDLAATAGPSPSQCSQGEIEVKVGEIWESLVSSTPRDGDNFITAGGDSFSALALVNTIR